MKPARVGALATLLVVVAHAAERNTLPVVSVCDAIAQRLELNGQMLAIRGVFHSGEGVWLTAYPDCGYRLVTKGVTWPNVVDLEYPNNKSTDTGLHAPFGVDSKNIHRFEKETARPFDPDTEDILATFVGLFQTYSDLGSRVNPNMQDPRFGFGHMGAAPARLIIQHILINDVSVVKKEPRR